MYLRLIIEIQVINSNGRITLSFVLGHTHEGLLRFLAPMNAHCVEIANREPVIKLFSPPFMQMPIGNLSQRSLPP